LAVVGQTDVGRFGFASVRSPPHSTASVIASSLFLPSLSSTAREERLRPAVRRSWKDKNGDGYIRRTEWHRLVAWGNLSTFAATLKKGAHVSVEGELRYREFVPKKQKKSKNGDQQIRVAEIHLSKIAKLDRAEKHDSDAPVPELGPETEAPF
jgi:single-strand DNA-binding protein